MTRRLTALTRRVADSRSRFSSALAVGTGETRVLKRFTKQLPGEVALAPDGRLLVGSGSDALQSRGVFAVDVETGHATLITREPNPTSLADQLASGFSLGPFTADGKALLGARGGVGIVKRGWPTGGETVVVPIDAAGAMVRGLTASPDGEWVAYGIAYPKNPTVRSEIRVTSLRSAQTKVVYTGGATEFFSSSEAYLTPQAWTSDSAALLLTGKTDASQKVAQLWTLDLAGGAPKPAGISAENIQVSLHPDGRQIVYTASTSKQELWVMEACLRRRWPPGRQRRFGRMRSLRCHCPPNSRRWSWRWNWPWSTGWRRCCCRHW